ncbi:hypothetical protein GSY69_09975 [Brevibacterium sp. 5221]|uniref:B3/B4 tRNA-binding domain-containing protein n=1 Tax=Brevibacterium rongguiense TaxID=2695267 RepID=A0A6N9H8I3_9MICO|nr:MULTISPECIES: phenylalanine--tRNA ligase beta subunit-related protein [Brevibacterium]MYM20283.1 hypothetical protein [Brevibacterium rongguiense]WAL39257.1 phenylalanine--tRNA ligase beta subunit-related protein [Brevibacterium sp. BRM-1]
MTSADATTLQDFLAAARVDEAVFELRPDYRVLLLAVEGIGPAPSDATSEALLAAAEAGAAAALRDTPVEELPHIAAWREAYRAFGAKPQRTRNSLEALTRRAPDGLPRVNRLTDVYNAVSVAHQIPLGGEDLAKYQGAPHLVRAAGDEDFDVVADGEVAIEHPAAGEVVWRDDVGVTCRRWNWRQGLRTRLDEQTTSALFILDLLAPVSDEQAHAAADELVEQLRGTGPAPVTARRLIGRA